MEANTTDRFLYLGHGINVTGSGYMVEGNTDDIISEQIYESQFALNENEHCDAS